ncbi:MAG: LamG-like jellyroll fold domain-containing protein [bacterium]
MKNNYIPKRFDPKIKKGQVFVIMPFKQMMVFEKIFSPISSKLNLNCILGGSIFEEGILLNDIIRGIAESEFVIADLTDKNPNVFYELGIAHHLRKRVIIITQNSEDVPSDLKGHKWYQYNINSKEGIDNLEKKIKNALEKSFKPAIIYKQEDINFISGDKGNELYLESDFIENDEGAFMIWAYHTSDQAENIVFNKNGNAWKYLFSHSGNSGKPIKITGQNDKGEEVLVKIQPNMLAVVKRYIKKNDENISFRWRLAFNNGQSTNQIIESNSISKEKDGWHLFTFVWSNANNYVKFFIDTKLIKTKEMTFWPSKAEAKAVIGAWTNRNKSHYFDNKIGHMKLWNKSISHEEIKKEFLNKDKLNA